MVDLHPNCRDRLFDIAVKAVSQVPVAKSLFIEPSAWKLFTPADEALPKEIRKNLAECVYERPFAAFAISHLSKELKARLTYEEDSPTRLLVELNGFENAREVASNLMDAFCSLPWRYTFIFSLGLRSSQPANGEPQDKEYVIAPNVSVVEAGPQFSQKFRTHGDYSLNDLILEKLQGGEKARKELKPGTWKSDSLYFVHQAEGFVADYFATQPVEKTWLLLRSFGGLMQTSATVEIKSEGPSSDYSYGTSFLAVAPLHVYQAIGDEWEPMERHTGSADYANMARSLQWILPVMEGDRVSDQFIKYILDTVKPAFGDSKESATLRQCGQWYFDSHGGSNHLLQFVQATVAVEILLGDKETSKQIGLGQLLANRCAFMLAKTHGERLDLLDKFAEIYETRSRIVHSGKNSLSEREWQLLHELRHLCGRLIRKDLDLMKPK